MKDLFVFHIRLPKCRLVPNRYNIRVFMSELLEVPWTIIVRCRCI